MAIDAFSLLAQWDVVKYVLNYFQLYLHSLNVFSEIFNENGSLRSSVFSDVLGEVRKY